MLSGKDVFPSREISARGSTAMATWSFLGPLRKTHAVSNEHLTTQILGKTPSRNIRVSTVNSRRAATVPCPPSHSGSSAPTTFDSMPPN